MSNESLVIQNGLLYINNNAANTDPNYIYLAYSKIMNQETSECDNVHRISLHFYISFNTANPVVVELQTGHRENYTQEPRVSGLLFDPIHTHKFTILLLQMGQR